MIKRIITLSLALLFIVELQSQNNIPDSLFGVYGTASFETTYNETEGNLLIQQDNKKFAQEFYQT